MSAREQGALVRTYLSTTARFVILTSDKSADCVMPCVPITSVLPPAAGVPGLARPIMPYPVPRARSSLVGPTTVG
nr:hypothetical protein GCM10020092_062860 [Actinoplanes digitatis]